MKKILTTILLTSLLAAPQCFCADYDFTEASTLTMVGKLFPDTPNPYHRVDTVKYKGFTPGENFQLRVSSGIAVAFRTNSETVTVKTDYFNAYDRPNSGGIATRGYDLYIRKDGQWLWAGSGGTMMTKLNDNIKIAECLGTEMKECILYLPLFSEEKSILIGTDCGSTIEAMENPFRHRVGLWGSSFTQGASTSRPGMAYSSQFSRATGIQLLPLGCSGNCKLQSYFAACLKDADVEAFVFDTFSNPSVDMIRERLFPFIEAIQEVKPDIPLIFQKTIYREKRNFNQKVMKDEAYRMEVADSMMRIACRKYRNVYWVTSTNATAKNHETSVDGTHPGDYGYTLWAESITKPILKILRKYGIK